MSAFSLVTRLRGGETVYCGWCALDAPIIAETVAREGFSGVNIDIQQIGSERELMTAALLLPDERRRFLGTDRPTHQQILASDELFASIERGTCIYTPVYEGPEPEELCFLGYSFD